MSLQRILTILLYILLAVSAVLIAIFYFGPDVEGTTGTNLEEPTITNFILRWAYGLLVVGAILAILFPLGYMIANPKNATKALMALVFIGVVVLVGYFLASDRILEMTAYQGTGNNPTTLKWAGTGIISMYLLLGLAVLSIIFSEIAKFFK
jgi:hypothetical protein